jgi:hypothetical protein
MAAMFDKMWLAESWLTAQPNIEVLYVSYNDVMKDPRPNAERINTFLGGSLKVDEMRVLSTALLSPAALIIVIMVRSSALLGAQASLPAPFFAIRMNRAGMMPGSQAKGRTTNVSWQSSGSFVEVSGGCLKTLFLDRH